MTLAKLGMRIWAAVFAAGASLHHPANAVTLQAVHSGWVFDSSDTRVFGLSLTNLSERKFAKAFVYVTELGTHDTSDPNFHYLVGNGGVIGASPVPSTNVRIASVTVGLGATGWSRISRIHCGPKVRDGSTT